MGAPEEFSLETPDNVLLHCRLWRPDSAAHGIVQIAHGMAEHAGRYADFAQMLTSQGWAAIADDHRGHGLTSGPRGHMGDRDGWNSVVEDLYLVKQAALERCGNLPVVLLGHSWGSLLSRAAAARWGNELSGLIVMGTAADPGLLGVVGKVIATAIARVRGVRPSHFLERLTFGSFNKPFKPAPTGFEWLSRDQSQVAAYVADPDCGFSCTAQFYADLISGAKLVNSVSWAQKIPCELPVLILGGGADPVGNQGAAPRIIAAQLSDLGVSNVELQVWPDMRHELLNEQEKELVEDIIIEWLAELMPKGQREIS
ncbi:MAG: lysophospholipase [Propionibacteriaceae bacterium]